MKLLLFLFLAGCAVKCDSENYVIQMPEDPPRDIKKPFRVYWNVPTMQCKSKKIPFKNLYEKYGIIQNANDGFRGEKIAILYDPGMFPALLKNDTTGQFRFRNGGVPQEGDLKKHLDSFRSVLEQSIPDSGFSGVGIIDFESWRPVFRQNFGVLVPYKEVSYEIERKAHWWWPKTWLQAEAKLRFEEAARIFMQNTISVAKRMRPRALWGYYGFPYCFNMGPNNMVEWCADNVNTENDNIDWLWSESTALYPSVYSSQQLSSSQLQKLIRGRVKESVRVRRNGTPILPYFWYRYRDGGFLSEEDLQTALKTFSNTGTSGFIIWGASADVNTIEKCISLLNYTEQVLGPAIAKYTKPAKQVLNDNEDSNYTTTETNKPSTEFNDKTSTIITTTTESPFTNEDSASVTLFNANIENSTTDTLIKDNTDPELQWDSTENYTQGIEKYVEKELNSKHVNNESVNYADSNITVLKNLNKSILIDFISTIFGQVNSSDEFADETEQYSDSKENEFITEPIDEVANTVTNEPFLKVTVRNNMETSAYSGLGDISKKEKKGYATAHRESLSITETEIIDETTKYIDRYMELTTRSTESYDKFTTKNYESSLLNQDVLFTLGNDYTTSSIDTETTIPLLNKNNNSNTTTNPSEDENLDYSIGKLGEIASDVIEITSEISSNRKEDISIEKVDITTKKPSKHETIAHPKDTSPQTLTSTVDSKDLVEETTIFNKIENTATSIGLVSKDREKESYESIIETREDDAIPEELTSTGSADQVAGSAFNNRPKYYFCIIFYFYSVSKCLCEIYGQCS